MIDLKSNIVDIIENWGLSYSTGNSLFYILNSKNEDVTELGELKKSLFFLQKRIDTLEKNIDHLENFPKDKIRLKNIDFKCINLKDRSDRREWVDSHLPKFDIQYKYHNALKNNENYKYLKFSPNYKPGNIGCATTHYDLLKNYSGTKVLGIFEDDVQLSEDFLDRFKYIEENFNLEWDMFFLSSFYHLNDDKLRWHKTGDFEFTDIKYIHRVYGSFCTHAYLVNPKSIDKILTLMEENMDKSFAIDHLYILIQPQLNCYSFTPGMATQIVSTSDIDHKVKDQSEFEKIVGGHYFINKLEDFNYDEYFKK
jgi:GR25 family glycosyltransferase involved in LPS biosynthesis